MFSPSTKENTSDGEGRYSKDQGPRDEKGPGRKQNPRNEVEKYENTDKNMKMENGTGPFFHKISVKGLSKVLCQIQFSNFSTGIGNKQITMRT